MRWPSKNPDDYVDGSARVPTDPPSNPMPARYGATFVFWFSMFFIVAALVSDPAAEYLLRTGWVLVVGLSVWWEFRVRVLVLVAAFVAGNAVGLGIAALLGDGLWHGASLGAFVALCVVVLVATRRNRRHPVEPRPQPAPLKAPAWLERIVPSPSKNPDDYV